MATFVLVHGGWHGGWCWKKVTPLLRAAGHEVYRPTLTGLGERAHLLSPAIGLDTHIQDVVGVLECEDLRGVILVGHSNAGTVISGVADRAAERLARLVYLDAHVVEDGQALVDILLPRLRVAFLERAQAEGAGWWIPAPAPDSDILGVTADADVAWLRARLGPQPLKTFTEPLRLTKSAPAALPRTYIYCTGRAARSTFTDIAERVRTTAGWSYSELPAAHDAMITAPSALADLLQEIARLP